MPTFGYCWIFIHIKQVTSCEVPKNAHLLYGAKLCLVNGHHSACKRSIFRLALKVVDQLIQWYYKVLVININDTIN